MASNIPLNDLIEALAGAVIEAQDRIEQHQIHNLLGYFDNQNRPRSLVVKLPSVHPRAGEGAEDYYRAPLLPLVSTNLLKIKDVEITFDVDLGRLTEESSPPEEPPANGGEPPKGGVTRKCISVDMAGGLMRNKGGSIHVVLRVEGAEPADGAARLINHLAQTQGVYKTVEAE